MTLTSYPGLLAGKGGVQDERGGQIGPQIEQFPNPPINRVALEVETGQADDRLKRPEPRFPQVERRVPLGQHSDHHAHEGG